MALHITEALERAAVEGDLEAVGAIEVEIERPQNVENGDFSSNTALHLARVMRMAPIKIAERIVEALADVPEIENAWAAPPGFVNLTLSNQWLRDQVPLIRAAGESYASYDHGNGQRVQVEFVSVNPTGPLHVGHARGAVIGSGIASVLEAAGYDVTREYYVNDGGNQMRVFNDTLYARYMQAAGHDLALPENAYEGQYLIEFAGELVAEFGDKWTALDREEAIAEIAPIAMERILAMIRDDVALLGIEYDLWFREKSLLDNGGFDAVIAQLDDTGHMVDRDGARWFTAAELGEDSDNVVIRSGEGGPTYFGTDIAYHHDKFARRNFERVVDVWGADHHGHIARLKAAMAALGVEPDRLAIILNQMVAFKEGQESLRFSKRKGVMVTLRELVNEVGADACRYIFMSRSPEAQMEFDIELAASQSMDNPVYYVQYAHARISSILRTASDQEIEWEDGDRGLLTHDREIALIKKITELPDVIVSSADRLEATQLPYYAYELARAFTSFYEECRVLSDDDGHLPLSRARLQLVDATRLALAGTLKLMGMSAPERM